MSKSVQVEIYAPFPGPLWWTGEIGPCNDMNVPHAVSMFCHSCGFVFASPLHVVSGLPQDELRGSTHHGFVLKGRFFSGEECLVKVWRY